MKIKRILWLLVFVLICPEKYYSQKTDQDNLSIKLGGYINWTAIFDTRQTVSMREGQFLLFPSIQQLDKIGNDINAKSNFNMLTVQTRLNGKIDGPEAFGAKTTGFIEAEFFGTSDGDANGFRLRHAYIGLKWEKFSLLVGQYWHPMFVTEAYPQVISFNTGAPFQPFSRNPQIKITQTIRNTNLVAVLYSQRDFTSNGPSGYSSSYMKNSAIPAAHFQVQTTINSVLFGSGIDYKVLTPRLETVKKIATDKNIKSIAGLAYLKISVPSFTFISEGIYGENMTDLLMLGGYAESSIDTSTGVQEYSNLKAYSIWSDVAYGTDFQIGMFLGYSKNLGSEKEITGKIYSRTDNISNVFRIAPRIQYSINKLKIGLELEYTQVNYGKPNNYGKVNDGYEVKNTRLLIGVFYNL